MKRLIDMTKEEQNKFFEDYYTEEKSTNEVGDEMVTVFENGYMMKEWTFEEIRERAQVTF